MAQGLGREDTRGCGGILELYLSRILVKGASPLRFRTELECRSRCALVSLTAQESVWLAVHSFS